MKKIYKFFGPLLISAILRGLCAVFIGLIYPHSLISQPYWFLYSINIPNIGYYEIRIILILILWILSLLICLIYILKELFSYLSMKKNKKRSLKTISRGIICFAILLLLFYGSYLHISQFVDGGPLLIATLTP